MKAMRPQKVIEAAQLYGEILDAHDIVAQRVDDSDIARLLDGSNSEADRDILLRHAKWICKNLPTMIQKPAGQAFCLRWIGCVEGSCRLRVPQCRRGAPAVPRVAVCAGLRGRARRAANRAMMTAWRCALRISGSAVAAAAAFAPPPRTTRPSPAAGSATLPEPGSP